MCVSKKFRELFAELNTVMVVLFIPQLNCPQNLPFSVGNSPEKCMHANWWSNLLEQLVGDESNVVSYIYTYSLIASLKQGGGPYLFGSSGIW